MRTLEQAAGHAPSHAVARRRAPRDGIGGRTVRMQYWRVMPQHPAITTPRRALPSVLDAPAPPPAPVSVLPGLDAGERQRLALGAVALLTALKLGAHLAANVFTPYAAHRDELLYMAMGRHLQVWRMDFPPLIALVSELTRSTFGDSLAAIRLGPALAGAATLVLAVLIARAMGGGRIAQTVAGMAVLTSPLFLRPASLFQPVVFDQLWWTMGLYALTHLGRDALPALDGGRKRPPGDVAPHQTPTHVVAAERGPGRRTPRHQHLAALLDRPAARWWLLLGAAIGLGLLTKFSIAFFGVGVLVGLLATPLRRTLLTRWPWLALGVALVLGAPSIAGQVALDWPVLGQMRELRAAQLDRIGPLEFLAGQLAVGPALFLALAGVHRLLGPRAPRDARPFRAVGWTCVAAFVLLLVLRGKPYYAGPIYPALFAAGAVALERATYALGRRERRIARVGAALVLAVFGLAMLPLGLPILPPPELARYTAAIGAGSANETNTGGRLAIPQDYADMLGWPQQAVAVARAFEALPTDSRADAVIIAGNYGQAGAIDFYGPRVYGSLLDLPEVISPAGSYWFFGPGSRTGAVAITIGIPPDTLRRYFRRVTVVDRVSHEQLAWVVPEERDVVVTRAEEPLHALRDLWPSLRP